MISVIKKNKAKWKGMIKKKERESERNKLSVLDKVQGRGGFGV